MSSLNQVLFAAGIGASGPAFISVGTEDVGSVPAPGMPAGFVAGNLLLLVIASDNTTCSTPTGYTPTNAAGPKIFVFYKVAVGGETTPTISLSGGTSGNNIAAILAYSNINASPLNSQNTVLATGTSTTPATTSITASVANTAVISIFMGDQSPSGHTWTAPANTTIRWQSASTAANSRMILVVDEAQTSSGATAIRTATQSASAAWATFVIVFKP